MKKVLVIIGLLILCQYAFAGFDIKKGVLRGITGNDIYAETLNIPNNVTQIGQESGAPFFKCQNLKTINIPDSVKNIDDWAFLWGCSNLQSINVNKNNQYYCSINGILYNKGQNKLIKVPNGIKNKSFYIQKSVISIEDFALSGCVNLQSINIPNSVKSIGFQSFINCSNLQSISIPGNIKNIGNHAFAKCSKLKSITISEGVNKIGRFAFFDCSELKSIEIPSSITFIGESAFLRCELKSIKAPKELNLEDTGYPEDCEIIRY